MLNSMSQLRSWVEYLTGLGHWPRSNATEPPSTLVLVDDAREALREAWTASIKKHFGRGAKASLPRIPKTLTLDLAPVEVLTPLRSRLVAGLKHLRTKLEKSNKSFGEPSVTLRRLSSPEFIDLFHFQDTLHFGPAGLVNIDRSERVNLGRNIQQRTDASLLIVGPAGSGKTTFCRWSALNDAERYMTAESKIIPVYVPLHRLARGALGSFADTFLSSLGESALLNSDAKKDFEIGNLRLRLYLDGLDEVPDSARRRDIMELARDGSRSLSPNAVQVIITSRDHVIGEWLSWLPRLALAGLEADEISNLTRQWLDDPKMVAGFERQLRRLPVLGGLMRTPLLATLVLLVFRRTGQLPENRAKLYASVVELLSGGWDLAKGVPRSSRFGRDAKILVLAQIAADIHGRKRKEFGRDEITAGATRVIRGLTNSHLLDLETELLEDGVISGTAGTYQFSHLSFQEFLVARSILGDPTGGDLDDALAGVLKGDDWWREVFRFYIALTGNPSRLCRWLRDRLPSGDALMDRRKDIRQMILEAHPSFPVEEVLSAGEAFAGDHDTIDDEYV